MSLEVRVVKQYAGGHAPRRFRLDASFTATAGFTVVFGPSGSGKSTLLECTAGLRRPDEGRILLNNRLFFDDSARTDVPPQSRNVGYVFQSPALFPNLDVSGNVGFGLARLARAQREARVSRLMAEMGISHLAQVRPSRLSGGEAQRVALARALAPEPQLLLLDEPLSALDSDTKNQLLHFLREYVTRNPIPVLYVTHALQEAFALAGQVLQLRDGSIERCGPAAEVLNEERAALIRELTRESVC